MGLLIPGPRTCNNPEILLMFSVCWVRPCRQYRLTNVQQLCGKQFSGKGGGVGVRGGVR